MDRKPRRASICSSDPSRRPSSRRTFSGPPESPSADAPPPSQARRGALAGEGLADGSNRAVGGEGEHCDEPRGEETESPPAGVHERPGQVGSEPEREQDTHGSHDGCHRARTGGPGHTTAGHRVRTSRWSTTSKRPLQRTRHEISGCSDCDAEQRDSNWSVGIDDGSRCSCRQQGRGDDGSSVELGWCRHFPLFVGRDWSPRIVGVQSWPRRGAGMCLPVRVTPEADHHRTNSSVRAHEPTRLS